MTKDSPSGGGPPPSPGTPRLSTRKAPSQPPSGAGAVGGASGCCPPPPPPPPPFHEDHRRELEALREELDAERLRSQEARRRFALEARELREAAERDRQLLADQLRSKWEQQRARELHQLKEAGLRQREAEIRQLLRWKEAELREAQELLQRERDAAMRQARDLQRQLAEELVSRGGGGRGSGAGAGAGLSSESRAKLQEVLGKLRWEVDGDQAARIRHLKAELELERSLFLKYILERFEGEHSPPGSPQRTRQASSQQHKLGKGRPRSLESLVAACSPDAGAASTSRSLDSNLSRCESPPHHASPEGGSPKDSGCPQQQSAPQKALEKEKRLEDGAEREESVDAPPEGKVSSWGSAGEGGPPATVQQQQQQQDWLSSNSYNQLVKQNTDLLKALLDLEQRCTHLKEENTLLRKSSFPEMKDKVRRLKRKNGELASIAKRLEERAKKLQESSLKVGSTPVPLTLTCSDVDVYKTTFARQRAKDLSEQASALLAKDQQLEALQRECRELQAKLTAGKERTYLLNISDFDRLLRESQREVLRLQRQIMLKNLKESLQPSKVGLNDASSPVIMQPTPSLVDACLEVSFLPKELPKALNTLVKNVGSEALPIGNGAKNNENSASKKDSDNEYQLKVLKKKLAEKCTQCENLKHEMEEKQKRCDHLESQLSGVLSENVRIAEENSQLHEKTERTEKIENENAEIKMKLMQATDDRNSAVRFTKRLEIKVENLEQVIRNMKEIAERRQQLESEHKETLLVLQKKEGEIQHLQQIQTEIKREHEESVQLLESQVRELENQYHSQTKHFSLLSQELERLQIKKCGLLESELSHTTCNSTATFCPEKLEQDTHHNFHCSKNSDEDSTSIGTVGFLKKPKELESQSNSSGSESIQNSSKSCLNPEEDTVGEIELETDKDSINLQLENQGPSKLHVFLARYSYDPFDGPNKNPEAELPLTAGEYVYIYGEMDEDGFYEGELMDGRRGMVPSNLVEEVSGNDLISFLPSEPSDILYNSYHEMGFPCQSTSSEEKSDSPDEDMSVSLQSNRLGRKLCDDQTAVPYPQNLTLIKQFARSIIISWDPPQMLDSWGEVHSYNIYVNTDLCHNVKHSSQMKAVIENLNLKLHSYRISVQSVTDKGNSDKMQCTFLVGNSFHIAPTLLELQSITPTSAEITWLPCNSNYTHTVYLNEKEYNVTSTGVYWYTFQNLKPSSQYSIKVETQAFDKVLEFPLGNLEPKSAAIIFTTPSAGPPHAPLDVQVQPSSSEFLVISWLPVTIDSVGSSNGVKVTGYAVYINGQKVADVISPTSGNVLLPVSQLHRFQESWKVSVRTVSPFGESEDSVPALIPSALLKFPSSLLSKSLASTQASELTVKEFLESEDGHILTTTSTSSSIFSHMDMAIADTNSTIHFTSNCTKSVVPTVVNISRNHMTSSTLTTSHNTRHEDEADSIVHRSDGKQYSEHAFPSLKCERSANSTPTTLQVFDEDTQRERSEECSLTEQMYTVTQSTDVTAKYSSFQHHIENSGANCLSPEPRVSFIELELREDSYRDAGTHNISLQEEMGSFAEKKHMKQIKQLCKELSNLSVSKVENNEEHISRTVSWQTPLGDHNHISDLSDIEAEESHEYKISIYGREDSRPQGRVISPVELTKDTVITTTLRADQTTTPSVPNSDGSARLFVALFDYDPLIMSPNFDAAEEELSFKEGQILKVLSTGLWRVDCCCLDQSHIKSQVWKLQFEYIS